MAQTFAFDKDHNLLVIRFSGVITFDEEIEVLLKTIKDPRFRPDSRILVDKRQARMKVAPEHVRPTMDLVLENLQKFGQPRVATVVAADYGFGMTRMLELESEGVTPHDFMVFRELKEACDWLGIGESDITWP